MGKKLGIALCIVLTALLIWLLPSVSGLFPISRDGTNQQPWQGVLRIWVTGDWSSNGLAWLSKQASAFEKAHPGVKVRLRRADQDAWAVEGAVLPDVIVFAPGSIAAPEQLLMPIAGATDFLAEALRVGRWQGTQYALPVALGGYAILIHDTLWPQGAALSNPVSEKKQTRYALHCGAGGSVVALAHWEAGRAGIAALENHPAITQATPEQAYQAFTGGSVAALVGTLDQVRRFAALESAGKGFAFRSEALPTGFCDQLLLVGIPRNSTDAGRLTMAEAMLQALTSLDAQNTLSAYGLLPIRTDAAAPTASTPLLQAVYRQYQQALLIPNAFGWQAAADEVFEAARHAIYAGNMDALHFAIEMAR